MYNHFDSGSRSGSGSGVGDGNISEEDTDGLTDSGNTLKRKHSKHGSLVILYGKPSANQHATTEFSDAQTLKLLNQESQCEGDRDGDYDANTVTTIHNMSELEDHLQQMQFTWHQQQPAAYLHPSQYLQLASFPSGSTSTATTPSTQHANHHNVMSSAEEDDNSVAATSDCNNNMLNVNIMTHLCKIKDTDARAIWIQACSDCGGLAHNQYAYLFKLYPFLVKKFQFTTRTKNRYPQIQQLEHYFLRMGGKYLRNTNFPVIHISKYDKFYSWFLFMCAIVSDLRMIYDDYNLDCLFYGKRTSAEILRMRPQGTFILSLTNKTNYLALKYKKTNKNHEISTIYLVHHGKDLYSVNKSKKQMSLYQIIRPRTYLKYLYTPQMLIDKKALF